LVSASCWPFPLLEERWDELLELPLDERPVVEPDPLALAREVRDRLLAAERDPLDPFLLDPFLADELRELEPDRLLADLLLPFLDVEREVELSVRFACVRPRLFPRRD
jgi:hypothetical protein